MTAGPDSTTDPVTAGVGAGPLEVARIGWRRARAFNVLNRGARSGSGALIAPWWWPVETFMVAVSLSHVRTLGGASMTLSDGAQPRVSRPMVVTAGFLVLAEFAVVVATAALLSMVLNSSVPSTGAVVIAMGIAAAPFLMELVVRICRLVRTPDARSLKARRRELAKKRVPVYVMSSFVRSTRAGEGSQLLRALQVEWERSGAVVLLHPANETVADYYARHGAEPDSGTRAVMRFDYRAAVTA